MVYIKKGKIAKVNILVKLLVSIPVTQQMPAYPDRWYTSFLLSWPCLFSESTEDGKQPSAPDRKWVSHNYDGQVQRGICIKPFKKKKKKFI